MKEQGAILNQRQQQQPLMNLSHIMMSMSQMTQPQPQMVPMNRAYGIWPPPSHFQGNTSAVGVVNSSLNGFKNALGPRNNWKGKKASNVKEKRRSDQHIALMAGSISGNVNMMEVGGLGNPNITSYQPPSLNELQYQNRVKTGKFFQRKKFNKSRVDNYGDDRSAPFAPRNTTSFIIRAKKSGGIASLVSPSPMTPAIIPTPIFSPSREVVVDMAKEEWGVDGYGSMKGLIRLRPQGHEMETNEDEEDGDSSESDVEGHVESNQRFDHEISRFEMIYNPNRNNSSVLDHHYVLENRIDDHDSHIAQLEEENLILKEKFFLMERELEDLRRRMQSLEQKDKRGDEMIGEMVDNESDNEIESRVEPDDNDNNLIHESEELSGEKHRNEIVETDEKVALLSHDIEIEHVDTAGADKANVVIHQS